MTNQLEALDRLIEAVEAGTAEATDFHKHLGRNALNAISAYNGSLDAAKALHEALLPGWVTWDASHSHFGYEWSLTNGDDTVYACSNVNPARAWLIAVLKAYRSVAK